MRRGVRCWASPLAGLLVASVLLGLEACEPMQPVKAPSGEYAAEARELRARADALLAELQRVETDMPEASAAVGAVRRRVTAARDELDRDSSADGIARAKQALDRLEDALVMVVPKDHVTVDACSKGGDFALAYESTCKRLVEKQKEEAANPPHQCIENDLADCTKQCERGHAGSCENLAFMYQTGNGVKEDQSKATPLFVKACEGSAFRACGEAGHALLEGVGISVDQLRGLQMLIRACENRDAYGCYRLAMYKVATGKPELIEQASRLYQVACNLEYADGCINLGVMLAEGKVVPADKKRAADLFKRACEELKEDRGCQALAILQGRKIPASPAQIERLWKELVAVADDLASKRFVARYAAQHARGTQGQRQVQLMQQHMTEFQREEYCPAKKAFVEAAGQAEFRKRTQAKCKDDPPVAGGLHGPETLTADCQAVFAGGCP